MSGESVDQEVLRFVDGASLNFADDTFRYVDRKRFSVTLASASNSAILEAVIRNPQYRDSYLTPESQSDTGTWHGPYLLSHIAASSFDECGAERGREIMREFRDLFGHPPSTDVDQALESMVFEPLATASATFELKALDEGQHELAHVFDDFRELIVLSADRRELLLLVAAVD